MVDLDPCPYIRAAQDGDHCMTMLVAKTSSVMMRMPEASGQQ